MDQDEAANQEFVKEGLCLNFIRSSWYLGAYLGPQEELEAWVKPQVEAFYADDAAFNGSARRSVQLLKILMKRGTDRGYFPDPAKYLFILDTPVQEEAAKREFAKEGLCLNFFYW